MARLLLGGLAAALALSVTPAHATPRVLCAEGFEVVCYVIGATCIVTKEDPCHP